MFRKMPFLLAIVLIAIVLLDTIIPYSFKQILYGISLSIKELIILMLPFIIFGLLFKSAIMLSKDATKIIGIILILVCVSNFISTFFSHYVGVIIYNFDLSMIIPHESMGLMPLWLFHFPKLIANEKAMFLGIFSGIIMSKWQPEKAINFAQKIDFFIVFLLKLF